MGPLDRLRRLLRGRPVPEAAPAAAGVASGEPADAAATDPTDPTDPTDLGEREVLDLPDGGLTTAVEALAARQPVPVTLGLDVPAGLARAVEAAAYRAVERDLEAVVATGTGRASVALTYDDGVLRVEVADDAWRVRATEVPTRP